MILDRLIEDQERRLMRLAETRIPNITLEDLMQPMDYPELENDPLFRHEEGILEGLRAARSALLRELAQPSPLAPGE